MHAVEEPDRQEFELNEKDISKLHAEGITECHLESLVHFRRELIITIPCVL